MESRSQFVLKIWVIFSKVSLTRVFWYLQSTHMASQQITEEAVYLCTGNPLPKDIEQISYWLLNESFSETFRRIQLVYLIIQRNIHQLLHLLISFLSFGCACNLTLHRNNSNEDYKGIGFGWHCERSNNVSRVHISGC